MLHIQNFIGGKFQDALSGATIDNFEPGTGKVFSKIPDSDKEDIDLAVSAAKSAFPSWSKTPKETRANFLYKIADLLEKKIEEFASMESQDSGKTIVTATSIDIPRAIQNFRFFAGAVLHHEDMATHHEMNSSVNYVVSQPIGVAGLISPWNLPLYLLTWKIAPAICVGNTCVCKPSELTPVTAYLFCKIISEAGLPAGVVNVVHGIGAKAGQAIVDHPDVPLISFTGGTVTGRKLATSAGGLLKRLSLELGGKNPNIIFDDCDLQKTVAATVRCSFLNQGEVCLCGERVFVQEGIYDQFLQKFIEETKNWKVGDPKQPSSHMGALISQQHLEKVESYIKLATQLGGKIEIGGSRISVGGECTGGYYYAPTIITGLPNGSRVCQEEIFGPVVNIIPFRTEDEVIGLANDIPYGLSASVFTENVGRAQRVALGLNTGTVWINCWLNRDLRVPFGGSKMSGIGREGGKFSFDFFCEKKTVCIKYN